MRDLVIASLLEFRTTQDGFNPRSMRWNKGSVKRPNERFMLRGVHISEVDWNDPTYTDAELLSMYNTIVSRSTVQM